MSMQMMQVPTTTLPSFAAAAEMTNNLGATKAGDGVLSRLDGSDAVAGKVKGQNGADGDNDGVVVKVGLKFGKQSVLWGGNCKKKSTTTTSKSSSSSAAAAAYASTQYEHDEYGEEHGDEQHDVVGGVKLARSATITNNATMEKDGPVVKNTVLLRGSSKPLACCVM